MPSILPIRAATDRSLTSSELKLNWPTNCSSLSLEVLGIAVEERVLDIRNRFAVVHEAIDSLSALDRIDDLVEEGRFAADDVDAGGPQRLADDPDWASAISRCAAMAAISMSLSLFSRSLNSSCSRPTPSNSFMALAFSSMPLASAAELQLHDGGFGRAFLLHGGGLGFQALGFGDGLASRGRWLRRCPAFSMASALAAITWASASPAAASSAVLGFGQHLGGLHLLLGRGPLGFGFDHDLLGTQFGGLLGRFGRFDLP